MKYGVPAALMLCLEWWAYELMSLYAGMLSANELAASVIVLNINTILFMFPHGMANAVCTLVGNSIGEEKPITSRKHTVTSLIAIV